MSCSSIPSRRWYRYTQSICISTSSDLLPGRIGIIDHDIVEVSNLQRQILHSERTIGMHKAESAAQALKQYTILPPLFFSQLITLLSHAG